MLVMSSGTLGFYPNIEEKYHARYKSKTSYYLIFKRVKFTYHKPGQVYQKHDPLKVKLWRKEIFPKIRKAWKDPNAIILCEDEMRLSTQTTFQKIWLPSGEYPEVKVSNKKASRSVYGFLNKLILTRKQYSQETNLVILSTTWLIQDKIKVVILINILIFCFRVSL